jgi:hypothetical protein
MSLTTWWRGTGRRRAADRIPVLTAERNRLLVLAWWQAQQLDKRDRQLSYANERTRELAEKVDKFAIENEKLRTDYDELFARYLEITAVRVPAPADQQPAITEPDLETTREMTIPAVWGMDGLRTPVPLWDRNAA